MVFFLFFLKIFQIAKDAIFCVIESVKPCQTVKSVKPCQTVKSVKP